MDTQLFEYKVEVWYKSPFVSEWSIKIETIKGTDLENAIDRFYQTHVMAEIMNLL